MLDSVLKIQLLKQRQTEYRT